MRGARNLTGIRRSLHLSGSPLKTHHNNPLEGPESLQFSERTMVEVLLLAKSDHDRPAKFLAEAYV